MNIGKAIKMCRLQKGWKQRELADKSDITVSYLSLIERSERDPNISTLQAIATALGIPLSILMFLSANSSELEMFSSELADRISLMAFKAMRQEGDESSSLQT